MKAPTTLLEAVRLFANEDVAHEAFRLHRWPGGTECPHCGSTKVRYMRVEKTKGEKTTVRRLWNCKGCKLQFTLKTGTVFEDSPIPFSKWLPALWLLTNAKNGISSYEVARSLGVTQKTAWFMLHRIRAAMPEGTFEKLGGIVEVDETVVGGTLKNMHQDRKSKLTKTGNDAGKTIVFGMLERGGDVRTKTVPNAKRSTLIPHILRNVETGSSIYSDEHRSYKVLDGVYAHQFVDHGTTYVEGDVHTNGLENFWSLLKRTIGGTYTHVSPPHLGHYLHEQSFRYNWRRITDGGRFLILATQVTGRRLTYKQLTGKVS